MLLLVILALIVGPTSGRHAYERDRRDADGDLAEAAANLPDNLIPQWYAYYIYLKKILCLLHTSWSSLDCVSLIFFYKIYFI